MIVSNEISDINSLDLNLDNLTNMLSYKMVKDLSILYSELLDQEHLDNFYKLKSSVEGWKKGNLLKVSGQKIKTSSEMSTENLRLYINQLASNNYNTIKNKISIELDNTISKNIFIDLILDDAIKQTNNLNILSNLINDLELCNQLHDRLCSKLNNNIIDNNNNNTEYDQFCKDNMSNLVYKNRYLLLVILANNNTNINILYYLNILKDSINNSDKNKNEISVITMVEILKLLNNKNKYNEYYDYLESLSKTKLITTKSIITILNLLDS